MLSASNHEIPAPERKETPRATAVAAHVAAGPFISDVLSAVRAAPRSQALQRVGILGATSIIDLALQVAVM